MKIITTFEDGSTSEEWRTAYRDGVETNRGTLYLSKNQDTELWKVGNTYQVAGTIGSFTNTVNEVSNGLLWTILAIAGLILIGGSVAAVLLIKKKK